MSFFKLPFTNLHEINLDWIIEEVKKCYSPDNPPQNVVLSVNGQTGQVVLYPDATIDFPAVSETSWTLGRTASGTNIGIKFNNAAPMQRVNGANSYNVYDQGNPPPYPVTSVNGHTGNVVVQVAFDNLTLPSVSFITAAPGHSWSLNRATADGDISIKLDTTNDTPTAYLEYLSEDETINETVKLLTLDDIPSSSGVVSINGQTGVVVLNADDIHRTSSNNETIEHAISGLVTDTQTISNKIGNTSMGTTATTITGAVKEHETDITGINNKIGNTAMGTTATTVTGAIAEHETDITTLNSQFVKAVVSGTTDANGDVVLSDYARESYYLLSAWTGGAILIPYAQLTTDGGKWVVKVLNKSTMVPIASGTSTTVNVLFKMA